MTDPAGLGGDLETLGLARRDIVLVHCSLRRVGLDDPGVLHAAVRLVVGDDGTLVVPTHTANNSTTSNAFRRATRGLDAEGLARFEAAMPGFDPARTPSYEMGAFAEHVRTHPGAVRSDHPQTSFAAIGPDAKGIVDGHELTSHLGESSPLGALYRLGGSILLLGVGYDACTALHLAEYRLRWRAEQRYRCYVDLGGRRVQWEFDAPVLIEDDFVSLGGDLDGAPFVRRGRVAGASARLLPVREAVDFAVDWMQRHRRPPDDVAL